MKIKLGLIIVFIALILLGYFLLANTNKANRLKVLFVLYFALSLTYIISAVYFYNFRDKYHWFDPYYQVSAPEFTIPYNKDSNEFRILVLGGSTSRDPRKNENENYPFILEKMLQKKYPEKKITVLNSGMNWFSTKHSLFNYVEYGHLFRPNLVIVLQGINDLYRSFSPKDFAMGDFHPSYKHFYGAAYFGAKRQTIESYFLNTNINDFSDYTASDFPFSEFKSYSSFVGFEEAIVSYVQADSSQCLLLTQPSIYQYNVPDSVENKIWFGKYLCNKNTGTKKIYPNTASLKIAMDSFNTSTIHIANNKKCFLLDADAIMPKNLNFFYDDVHYTDKGTILLAEKIFNFIIDNQMISQKKAGNK